MTLKLQEGMITFLFWKLMTSHENQEYDNLAACRGPGFI